MAAVLLYTPTQRWQIWAAFVGATLIHVAAIALAAREESPPPLVDDLGPADVIIESIVEPPPPQPIDDSPPDVPPPIATPDSFIPDESPTPPPIRKRTERPRQPLVRPTAPGPRMHTIAAAKVLALSAPRPAYPYEARRQRATGSGVALLTIDVSTGEVTDVRMSRSTGNPLLDNATVSAFRRWRFRPGTVSQVHAPITFTLTGAAY
jgi:protein TonB